MRSIAKVMRMSRLTIYKYIESDCFPERAASRPRESGLNMYLPYIHKRGAGESLEIDQEADVGTSQV
jgi:hypothetical protein